MNGRERRWRTFFIQIRHCDRHHRVPMYQTRTEWALLRQASIGFGVFTLSFSGGLQSAEIGKNGFGITNITESKRNSHTGK
jgi:hypothetical protein